MKEQDKPALTDEQQLIKATAESAYWFSRWQQIDKQFAHMAFQLDNAMKGWEEARKTGSDFYERFDLLNQVERASAASGYRSTWYLSGVTAEKLREELKAAKAYQAPWITRINDGHLTFKRPAKREGWVKSEAYMLQLETEIRRLSQLVAEGTKK